MTMPTANAKPKPKKKQRSALDIEQVLDDLDALLESSQPLGKGHLQNPTEVKMAPHMGAKTRRTR